VHQRAAVGFPEFCDRVVDEFPLFFQALPALQEALNDLTSEAHESISAQDHLILNLGLLVGVSMMEVVLLGVNGFGPGAMKSVRSLMEASVTAEYIRLHPEDYEDFFEWGHMERFQEVEFLREYLPNSYAKLEREGVVDSLRIEVERVADRFGKRRSWCKHDLAERARQTNHIESYRVVNPTASSFIHVTHYGLQKRFEGEDVSRMAVPPSMSWVMQAFVSGHALTLGMVYTLIQVFHPEEDHVVGSLEGDYRKAWPPEPS
jgi:Family of unknown function (DUF5677)